MPYRRFVSPGFTLPELLITIAIIGILATVVLTNLTPARDSALQARALVEFRQFENALEQYKLDTGGSYPPDTNRDVPAELANYLSGDDWPEGPWPGSVYDWDNWDNDGERTYQLSLRFCPVNGPLEDCSIPDTDWAENFDVNSSFFYCFSGDCQAHPSEPADYPGHCVNCDCQDMATCNSSD